MRREPDYTEAYKYYQATYRYTENLRTVLRDLRQSIEWVFTIFASNFQILTAFSDIVTSELRYADRHQALGIAVLVLVLIISPIIILLVRNATLTIQIFSLSLAKKAHELNNEKRKADMLLLQMLPPTVARSLQQKKPVTAETFESVTVYFSDIHDFHTLTAESTPLEVNWCQKKWDWEKFLSLFRISWNLPSKSFIWVTSKYLGSCWSYRKTKTTLLYQTTNSASYWAIVIRSLERNFC